MLLFTAALLLQAGNPLSQLVKSVPQTAKLGKHQLLAAWSLVTYNITSKSSCSIQISRRHSPRRPPEDPPEEPLPELLLSLLLLLLLLLPPLFWLLLLLLLKLQLLPTEMAELVPMLQSFWFVLEELPPEDPPLPHCTVLPLPPLPYWPLPLPPYWPLPDP